jgi:hypothetical protein
VVTKPSITICSSASFYRQAIDLDSELQALGFTVVLPDSALKMKESGDFDVTHYRTWFNNPDDYDKKAHLIRLHFDKIAQGDGILVLNFEKNGKPNYIGGNVLMEMSTAFFLHKPIFILNGIPEESPFLEEIRGMQPVVLQGDTEPLTRHYKLGSTASA